MEFPEHFESHMLSPLGTAARDNAFLTDFFGNSSERRLKTVPGLTSVCVCFLVYGHLHGRQAPPWGLFSNCSGDAPKA